MADTTGRIALWIIGTVAGISFELEYQVREKESKFCI